MHLRRSSTWNQFSGFENSILHSLDFHCVYAHVFFEFFFEAPHGHAADQNRRLHFHPSEML